MIGKLSLLSLAIVGASFSAQAQVAVKPENGYALGQKVPLPEPYSTDSTRRETKVVGWSKGKKPTVPDGFEVKEFAGDLQHPRWIYILPNEDVLVAESNDSDSNSANRITLFRDKDKDGVADERHVFLENLNQPFGMALIEENAFYVANTDSIMRFPYKKGIDSIGTKGEVIHKLPAGGYNHHWTRNIEVNDSGDKLLLTVGSSSNVGEYGIEKEARRAKIFTLDLEGNNEEVYASGVRNPNGLDYNPVTGELWAAVNERDELGDNLVPDYVTSIKKGGFYGWPYKYFGEHADPRWQDRMPEDLPKETIVPDIAVGNHTATMDLEFYKGEAFPEKYHNGLFAAQHGSWNRAKYNGYRVIFMPFKDGKPTGEIEEFMGGFLKSMKNDEAYGRPVAVRETPSGMLLISDDSGNKIWSVQATSKNSSSD
ncbi:sorbosone dehydrogenase family protein [Alteromonas pelagimontana]|uniref:Sorbosone dehydrogenase family protein n=1 Tax=Alteromonas pelagimontana TaxID=1858656 RepID=A0A6M4MDX2_9ALTE|nr:sorbosone dehydrogenase family protein [Alteromonas pelagimontana]QJR81309.1 sorbosone dehydrogenase family protein [Alteromonas pelagimontana]